ncbi:uncharacterized protein LOC127258871 isoform X2 [Andrographis paniculata]|uniref:uncharacterized protein LOC127258871 isoform X2 n=1 Tax=Andrographis paniculata TaxID=175694 RepID=UPI0021E90D5C|nr:uncharacterized protein LOC127258871 isoform X2 [Andrographis paniculata]
MDLEKDWELLPDEGFLDINDDDDDVDEKKIYSCSSSRRRFHYQPSMFQMNYFVCPSPKSESLFIPLVSHLPTDHDSETQDGGDDDRITATAAAAGFDEVVPIPIPIPLAGSSPQVVFLKKVKEITESVVDTIKVSSSSSWGNVPRPREIEGDNFQFVEEKDPVAAGGILTGMVMTANSRSSSSSHLDSDDNGGEGGGGPNNNNSIWKWRWGLSGVGAICSFGIGVAAAAAASLICVVILNNSHHHQLHFQLNYPNSNHYNYKGTKESAGKGGAGALVDHVAIAAAVRGGGGGRGSSIPITTATRITFGGYYQYRDDDDDVVPAPTSLI